jgi:hypothetical protein
VNRILLAIAFLLSCSAISRAQAIVTKANATDRSGSSFSTLAMPSQNVAAGNLIFAMCGSYTAPGTVTVTDTGSDTFTPSPDGLIAYNSDMNMETFYAKNTAANASDVVTCHYSTAAAYLLATSIQASGLSTSSPFDTHAMGTGQGTTQTTGSFTTATASEIIFAGVYEENAGNTLTAGTNYTLQNNPAAGTGADETRITVAILTGTTATFSDVSNEHYIIQAMTFEAATGSTCTPTLALLGVGRCS